MKMRLIPILAILAILIALLCLADFLFRRKVVENSRAGQLYKQEKYDEAGNRYAQNAKRYQDPIPKNNQNKAHYKQGNFEEALQNPPDSLSTSKLSAEAWYDMGNAHFQKKDYTRALDAYKKALKIDPEDRDAKANYELVKRKLKEQQKPQSGSQPKPEPRQNDKKQEDNQEVMNRLRALDQAEALRRKQGDPSRIPNRGWY